MKRTLWILILVVLVSAPVFSGTQVRLTGNIALDFIERPSLRTVIDEFSERKQDIVWGFGWEVIFDYLGIGGTYLVNFFQGNEEEWWFDWIGEAFYLSYHFFGGGAFIDPFVEVGVGSAGRVSLEEDSENLPGEKQSLYLSVYPLVSGGLALDFRGFIAGLKLTYIPTVSPPPATNIQNFPLGNFLVTFFGGAALGSHR